MWKRLKELFDEVAHLLHSGASWFYYMVRPDGTLQKDKVVAGVPKPFQPHAEHVVRASEVAHDFIHANPEQRPGLSRAVEAVPPDWQQSSGLIVDALGKLWEGGKLIGQKMADKDKPPDPDQAT